ncbi:FGGY-family carbohydrate kinase [Diaminobutyricimonas aerilata]|uniref:FGGY-family carbohydrate kinase n=1 Tax=Diaminobutyricimonas aerilata TaxID=1162967 RepID=UPI0012FD97B4|nr:FGGY family carbohydrate kinase [Diaminobutyricimonas aerilata]
MSGATPTADAVLALGIDVGSTNTKVALVAIDDTVRELDVRSVATPADADGVGDAVRGLVDTLTAGRSVAAIGIASMAETGVALDASNVPLTPLVRWDGARGAADAAALLDRFGPELFARTGVPPGPKTPLATWAWLRRTQPTTFGAMRRWVGVADLVALALTGEHVTDHTLAGRTGAYRLPEGTTPSGWDDELLDAVGMHAGMLPAVGASAVTTRGVPVVVAGHDHSVGAWAAGLRAPGSVADSVGTAEAVLRMLHHPADRAAVAATGMSIVRSIRDDAEVLLAGHSAAGALLRQWCAEEGVPEHRAFADLPDGPVEVAVLPYPRGRQTPAPDPHARLVWVDAAGSDRRTRARALLDGLALHARWMYDAQTALAGDGHPERIAVLGGPARNPEFAAIKAAVSPAPLALVTAREPVATGAAMIAVERTLGHTAPVLPARPVAPAAGDYSAAIAGFPTLARIAGISTTPEGAR